MKIIYPSLYGEYSKCVNKERAFPLNIDSLGFVDRRLIFVLYNKPKNEKTLSARIVGDTIGKFHPHGDIPVYGSLAKLVHDEYVDGCDEAWGSIGRDKSDEKPGAQRYTHCKLKKWVRNLIEYINFAPMEIIEISDEEPLYLPSPISLGLIGHNVITGIGVGYKTTIPKYKIEDLAKRLKWILENKDKNIIFDKNKLTDSDEENELLFGPCIKPNGKMTDVKEIDKGDFYELLFNGIGKCSYTPYGEIKECSKNISPSGKMLVIYGRSPNSNFEKLKEDTELINGTIKINCDILHGNYKNKEIIRVINRKNDKTIEEWSEIIYKNYLTKTIYFEMIFHDLDGTTITQGVDDVLFESYNKWKLAVINSIIYKFNIAMKTYFKTYVLVNIISPIIKNGKFTNTNDIILEYNENCTSEGNIIYKDVQLMQYDTSNKSFITYNEKITPSHIEEIIDEKKIKHLTNSNIYLTDSINKINEIIIEINNIDSFCFNYICNLTNGVKNE